MHLKTMLPGSRSRTRRRARGAVKALRHPRAARRGTTALMAIRHPGVMLGGKAGKQAVRHPRATARTARVLSLSRLAGTAWVLAATPRRRRRSKATVAAGAVGVAGAGAAAAYVVSRRSGENGQATDGSPRVHTTPQEGHPAGTGQRSDRDIGGPTAPEAPNQGATGGAPGTPPDSGFEPHT